MRWTGLGALGLLAVLALAGAALAQGPQGVHVTYGDPPASNLSVAWIGPPAVEATVAYGPEQPDTTVEATSEPIPFSDQHAYRAWLAGLDPATTYRYEVRLDGEASPVRTVTTAPEPGTANVTFTAYADHGTVGAGTEEVDEKPARVDELAVDLAPDAHLVPGDLAYARGDPETWDAFLGQIEPFASRTPYLTVPGNHEREPAPADTPEPPETPAPSPEEPRQGFAQYDARFPTPNASTEPRWYAAQIGNVLVVGTNTETACQAGDRPPSLAPGPGRGCEPMNEDPDDLELEASQTAFLRSALAEAAADPTIDWRIVLSHHPLVSSGPHGNTTVLQEGWGPLFAEHGVDLVLAGHDHVYERSLPVRNGTTATAGTTHITVGASGAELYNWATDTAPHWSAARQNTTHGVLELAIDGDELTGRFHTVDGDTFDRFRLQAQPDSGARLTGLEAEGPADGSVTTSESSPIPTTVAPLVASLATAGAIARRP